MNAVTPSHASSIPRRCPRPRRRALPLEELNPADPQGFVDDTVGYIFERLRREDPVHRSHSPIPGIDTYWSVTRYQDIMQVDTSHGVFSSEDGITLMDFPPGDEQKLAMFIAMDPPKHDEQRKAVNPIVAPANLNNWQDLIRERTGKVLDSLPRNETFNWVDQVSIELTTYMLATLFDFPLRRPPPADALVRHGDRQQADQSGRARTRGAHGRIAQDAGVFHPAVERAHQRAASYRPDIDAGPRTRDEKHGAHGVHGQPGVADRRRQ